jgi:uncharacterized membrane protein
MSQQPPSHSSDIDPRSAAVLQQAYRQVHDRRETAAYESAARQRPWTWASVGLIVLFGVLLAAWPAGTLIERLRWLMQGVCDQVNTIPSWPVQLPLDARCTGIYATLLATFLMLLLFGRAQAAKLPLRWLMLPLVGAIALMAIDGVNSLLAQYGYNVYPPQNALRLASGVGAGVALAVLGLPLFNSSLWAAPRRDQPIVRSWGEFVVMIGVAAIIGVLAWSGATWLLYPLAFFSVAGIIGGLFVINLLAIALANGSDRRVLLLAQLACPAAISIILTAGELALLAWLRTALERATTLA